MKRRKPEHVSHDRWLVSYADFITLLFAFFVVLYSSAQVDKKRVGQLSAAIQAAFQELGAFPPAVTTGNVPPSAGPPAPPPAEMHPSLPAIAPAKSQDDMRALEERLRRALAEEIEKKEVSLHVGPDGLVLSLRELGFFDSGSARIRPQALPAFTRLAEILKDQPHRLRIEGHTDNIPIHTRQFASNWELSTARSTEVVRLLIMKYGFEPERLSAAGYGEFHPAADNTTSEGRESNRRVDVVVLAEKKN